jgi:hypothetical protein
MIGRISKASDFALCRFMVRTNAVVTNIWVRVAPGLTKFSWRPVGVHLESGLFKSPSMEPSTLAYPIRLAATSSGR